MLSALIFDVDGTLAETEEAHRLAFNETFAAHGLGVAWSPERYEALLVVSGGKERIAADWAQRNQPPLPPAQIAALHAHKTERYTARVATGAIELRPGIARLMAEAAGAGLAIAIATTTSLANVQALLATTGLPSIAVIAAGDEVPAKKPAPDIYLLALRRLGLPPTACLAFEDTTNGLSSALGASIPCIVTPSLYGGPGPFPGACAVLTTLGDPGTQAEALAGPSPPGGIATLAWLRALHANTT